MKILFFINAYPRGGKERRLTELMKALNLKAHVTFELAVMSEDINYPEIFDLGIKINYLVRKTKKDFSIFPKLYRICKRFQPDFIHCWDSMTAFYSVPICKILNIQLINGMVVDAPNKQNFKNKHWLRAKLTFPFSNLIIGNSNAGLNAYRAPEKRSVTIYNGMDMARFDNLKSQNLIRKEIFGNDENHFFIAGMVAAFEDRKDYKTMINAAVQLTEKHSNIFFVLIGGGDNLDPIKKSVPDSLSERIIFLGKRNDIESIVNIFDVGILLTNSKVHGEGISNSIIEYMALRKPVIATRGGGTNEVVCENENGFLIDAYDEDQLVNKIEFLMKNKPIAYSLGQKGRELINNRFDLKIMANNYINVYQKLLKEKKI